MSFKPMGLKTTLHREKVTQNKGFVSKDYQTKQALKIKSKNDRIITERIIKDKLSSKIFFLKIQIELNHTKQ